MNDFERDDKWQKEVRDLVLIPGFYEEYALQGRFVTLDNGRFAAKLQRGFSVDTVIQRSNGRATFVEEKIVRWPGYAYTAFALETDSCTIPGREKDGWMRYGDADWLLYGFMRPADLLIYIIEFPALQAWFLRHETELRTFRNEDTLNKSAGRLAPLHMVTAAIENYQVRRVAPNLQDPAVAALFESRAAA